MYARLRCGGNLPLCLAFGTGEGLLWYGICVRCSKQAPWVRDAFSEAFGVKNRLFRYGRDIRCMKTPFFCTEGVFRGTRCSKQASTVRKRYSVPKTGSCGTRRIFKGPQNSRLHRLWTAYCRGGSRFSARNGPALFVRSGDPFPCSFDGTRDQKRPSLGGEQT